MEEELVKLKKEYSYYKEKKEKLEKENLKYLIIGFFSVCGMIYIVKSIVDEVRQYPNLFNLLLGIIVIVCYGYLFTYFYNHYSNELKQINSKLEALQIDIEKLNKLHER